MPCLLDSLGNQQSGKGILSNRMNIFEQMLKDGLLFFWYGFLIGEGFLLFRPLHGKIVTKMLWFDCAEYFPCTRNLTVSDLI